MPRVKKGVASHRRHKKLLKQARGYRGGPRPVVPDRAGECTARLGLCVSGPPGEEEIVPEAMDHSDQRGRTALRIVLQCVHGRPEQDGCKD